MRIGELLVECELITPKQLAGGLEYARAKGLPIGRVLCLLRYLQEDGLEIGLLGQRYIRSGTDAAVVVRAIKESLNKGASFSESLKGQKLDRPTAVQNPEAVVPSKSAAELLKLGDEALNEDRLTDAERFFRAAVDICNADQNGKPLELADASSRLAAFYMLTNRWDESAMLYMIALRVRQEAVGPEDISVARVLQDLCDLYDVSGQYDQAVKYGLWTCAVLQKHLPGSFNDYAAPLRRLTLLSKLLPEEPFRRIGEMLTDSGILSQEQLKLALQSAKQSNKPLGSVLRNDRLVEELDLQSVLSAQLLVKQKVLTESVAIEILKVAHSMRMPLQAVIKHFRLFENSSEDDDKLGELVAEQDRLLAAENVLGVEHPEVALIALSLADKFLARNSMADAETFLKRAIAIDASGRTIDPDAKTDALEKLINIYTSTGRNMLAVPLLLKALEHFAKIGQSDSPRSVPILITLARLEMDTQSYPIAMSFLRSAQGLQSKLKVPPVETIPVLEGLVRCFIETDMVEEAQKLCLELLSIAEQVFGPVDGETAKYMEKLADVHALLGDVEQAKVQYVRCLQVYEYALNVSPAAAQGVKNKLAGLRL